MNSKPLRFLTVLLLALALITVAAGIERYGSADNLQRRIAAEFVALRPHPQFVPTPLSTRPPWPTCAWYGTTPGFAADRHVHARYLEARALVARAKRRRHAVARHDAFCERDAAAESPCAPGGPHDHAITNPPHFPSADGQPDTAADPIPTRPFTGTRLTGLTHIWQSWNNCGPATLAMALNYFGKKVGQQEIGAQLRPDPDDKNVGLEEMAAYAQSQGLSAISERTAMPSGSGA